MPDLSDLVYYSFSGILCMALIYVVVWELKMRHSTSVLFFRLWSLGLILTSCGGLITVLSALLLNEAAWDGIITYLQYQMIHFSIFYVAMGLILYGTNAVALATNSPRTENRESDWNKLRLGIGILFIISIVVACSFLYNPGTYQITRVGSRVLAAQQQVFFLPLIFTLIVSAIVPIILVRGKKDAKLRGYLLWYASCSIFTLVGLLRESTIIPSSGNQVIDNLIVFLPLTIGGLCLLMSARASHKVVDMGQANTKF